MSTPAFCTHAVSLTISSSLLSKVLHGDHGWGLGENNHWHKMTNTEDTARVPLIIAAPFKPASFGKVASQMVMLVDMYPTIAALSGSGAPFSPLEGTDFSAVLDNPASAKSAQYAYTQYPRCPVGGDPSKPAGWAKNYCKGNKRDKIDWMGLSIRDSRWRFTLCVYYIHCIARLLVFVLCVCALSKRERETLTMFFYLTLDLTLLCHVSSQVASLEWQLVDAAVGRRAQRSRAVRLRKLHWL